MKDGVKARYTLEFKREAVRLVHGGEKVSAAARTLGVSGQSLDNRVKAEAAGRLRDVRGKAVTAEQMEIERDRFMPLHEKRVTADDPYFSAISSGWGEALKKAFVSLPDYSF